jgi:2-oxo-3-hexenedioate decarboxylase/2-keto-4-pentenoate hydratase
VSSDRSDAARHATAAALLVASRLSGSLLESLPPDVRPADELTGYAVQRCAHALLGQAGFGRQVGWKIGCTTAVMQAYLGVPGPCAGGMFQANTWRGHHHFKTNHFKTDHFKTDHFKTGRARRFGAECEIAIRLAVDLPPRSTQYRPADVARSVAASMAAIEVVEDRYVDYGKLDTPTLIADDFFHLSCVLGPEVEEFDPEDLGSTSATMFVNGEPVGSGRGYEIMGDPLAALTWLANSCASRGTHLLAGDIVLLGSVVRTHWVVDDAAITAVNDKLGEVRASFAPPQTQRSPETS